MSDKAKRSSCHKAGFFKYSIFLLVFTLVFSAMISGCSNEKPVVANTGESKLDKPVAEKPVSGVAATVAGNDISEQSVSDYISSYRTYIGRESDVDWATFLDESGVSAGDVRDKAVEVLAESSIIEQRAAELGIEASDAEISEQLASIRKLTGYEGSSEGAWSDFITTSGYADEAAYKADLRKQLLTSKLIAAESSFPVVADANMLSQANSYPEQYTGKRLIVLAYPAGRDGHAAAFMDESGLASGNVVGEQAFRDAAAAEVDDGYAEKVEPSSWTCLDDHLSATLIAAVNDVSVGHAGTVIDDDGIFKVVYVAEQYTAKANGKLSLADMPDDIRKQLESDTARELNDQAVSDYMDGLVESSDLEINPMPTGLPYDVDMSLSEYVPEEDDSSSSTGDVELVAPKLTTDTGK